MLTPKQIEDARKQLGIHPDNPATPTGNNLLSRLESSQGNSFLGNVARETIRPFAKLGTSVVNLAQDVTGNKETQPFSGDYLGEVKKIGDGFNPLGLDKQGKPTGEAMFSKNNVNALKDSVKTGVDIGLTTAGGGVAKNVAKTGIKEGIIQGVKTGAKAGSIVGGIGGVSTGLDENATLSSTLKNTAIGAIGGGAVGGALGGIIALPNATVEGVKNLKEAGQNVIKKIKGKPVNEQEFAQDLVMPLATKQARLEAIQQRRVTEPGWIKPSKILPSKRDVDLADSIKGLVSIKKTHLENVDSLDKTIKEINTGVKTYVKQNKVPFNTNQLTTQLNKGRGELKLVFASDAQAEKTYSAVVKEFIKHVGKRDTEGLLEARQSFDKIPAIKKLLDSRALGENTKKEIVLTARKKANEYIASLLPKGNKYRADLLKESKLIEVIGNIAEKNPEKIGLNKLQSLASEYPVLKYIAGLAVGVGSIGVGGAIINSSD